MYLHFCKQITWHDVCFYLREGSSVSLCIYNIYICMWVGETETVVFASCMQLWTCTTYNCVCTHTFKTHVLFLESTRNLFLTWSTNVSLILRSHYISKRNQNTQNECFLISTRQNNMQIFPKENSVFSVLVISCQAALFVLKDAYNFEKN